MWPQLFCDRSCQTPTLHKANGSQNPCLDGIAAMANSPSSTEDIFIEIKIDSFGCCHLVNSLLGQD